MSEVDRVEIVQQDLRLGHALFELIGKELFLDLSLDTILGGLIRPVCKNVVFDQLLGNSTGAFREIKAAFKAYIYGAEDTGDIDTAVLVETLVLDRDKGVGKVLGDPGLVNRDTVGIGRDQFGDLIALAVVNKGRESLGTDIDRADVRRYFQDSSVDSVYAADTDDTGAGKHDDQNDGHRNAQTG